MENENHFVSGCLVCLEEQQVGKSCGKLMYKFDSLDLTDDELDDCGIPSEVIVAIGISLIVLAAGILVKMGRFEKWTSSANMRSILQATRVSAVFQICFISARLISFQYHFEENLFLVGLLMLEAFVIPDIAVGGMLKTLNSFSRHKDMRWVYCCVRIAGIGATLIALLLRLGASINLRWIYQDDYKMYAKLVRLSYYGLLVPLVVQMAMVFVISTHLERKTNELLKGRTVVYGVRYQKTIKHGVLRLRFLRRGLVALSIVFCVVFLAWTSFPQDLAWLWSWILMFRFPLTNLVYVQYSKDPIDWTKFQSKLSTVSKFVHKSVYMSHNSVFTRRTRSKYYTSKIYTTNHSARSPNPLSFN